MIRSPAQCATPRRTFPATALAVAAVFTAACSDNDVTNPPTFTPDAVVTYDQLKAALVAAVGNPPFASSDPNYTAGFR